MTINMGNELFMDNHNLEPSVRRNSVGTRQFQERSKIFTLNHFGVHPRTIAWFMNRHISTVNRWVLRLRDGKGICDQKRSGRPRIYTDATQLKTIAFYCQISPLPGCNSWSLRWAEKYLKKHDEILGCSMSHSTIQRILKNHALRPHLHKYFLTITDPDFFPKMQHCIDLYLKPPEYLFNFDECTGIQAKCPLAPDLPVSADRPRLEEFEYRRNGTRDLMAFLNPKTGEVFGKCTQNHNTQTLVRVFKEHVRTLPSHAQIHYIMDNLNTHLHNDFCAAVAELSGVTYAPIEPGAERRKWLQKDDKRIVVHFVPFHGSWLNMIEIWFGILQKKCLKHQSFASVQILKEVMEEFIETWNQYFAHPFTWKYTGEGLHEKAVNRFNKLLLIESKQADITSLTKQLLLMCNIAKNYHKKVHKNVWDQLRNLFLEKKGYINSIVGAATKERQISKAQNALDQFRAAIISV